MRAFPWLVLASLALLAGCATSTSSSQFVALRAPPRAMAPRDPTTVEVLTAPPTGPAVTVGLIEVVDDDGSSEVLLARAQTLAAAQGCDALVIGQFVRGTHGSPRLHASCVYYPGEQASTPPQPTRSFVSELPTRLHASGEHLENVGGGMTGIGLPLTAIGGVLLASSAHDEQSFKGALLFTLVGASLAVGGLAIIGTGSSRISESERLGYHENQAAHIAPAVAPVPGGAIAGVVVTAF
jgi:hypothetical protein